jgi:hypothetical protein
MSSALTLPSGTRPSNLHLPEGMTATFIDADMYDICERVKEISPRLAIVLLEHDSKYAYAIIENCVDGVERLVFKVQQLDGRVIDKLRKIMALPLEHRIIELEKEHERILADYKEQQLEDMYDRIGRPMWTDLERCGFIQRPVSYPKAGVAGGKGSRKRGA